MTIVFGVIVGGWALVVCLVGIVGYINAFTSKRKGRDNEDIWIAHDADEGDFY